MARKYRCPYCGKMAERNKLSSHIDKHHSDMLNNDKGYTANRIVFDLCNKKEPVGAGFGLCRICKKHTNWDEKNVRYEAYCSNACKAEARQQYEKNMLRVHGKTTLLDDPEWQENKMLANRGISGKYRWSDGTYKTYVGSYERKFLEFCDTVLNIDSEDLLTPGPKIEYEINGVKRTWITDAIYLPYNLVFDIKDGGDNKNNREMPEYRAKQEQKEKFITDQGVYNYIRLTNNEFVQLLTIFAELKEAYMGDEDPKTISRIHEHMAVGAIGGMPVGVDTPMHTYVINYMSNERNTRKKSKYALSNDITSEYILTVSDEGKIKREKAEDIFDEDTVMTSYKYLGDSCSILKEVYSKYKNEEEVPEDYFATLLTEFDEILSDDQLKLSSILEEVDIDKIYIQHETDMATLQFQLECIKQKPILFPVLDPEKYEFKKSLLEGTENLAIVQSLKDHKYFAINTISGQRTKGFESIYEINKTHLNSICQHIYKILP